MQYYERIRQIRESKKETQSDIAKLLKTTTQYYQKYEKGKHPLPIVHLITLCKHWDISSDYILGLD